MFLDPTSTSHAWIAGFATRLLEICPRIGAGRAVQYAVMRIHDHGDADPCMAAEAFALERQFHDVRCQESEIEAA
jgi:hypothetical protein